ncbi:class I SAM-dependent DNA methyltransferase [Mycoplasma sp. P36-A1]|uniref:class I SAM-dependent DNA methyltransferase n=1 Tax=Mycoplasma sp. P36-A1 TaxID=3252900 RepID=UPI003C2D3690
MSKIQSYRNFAYYYNQLIPLSFYEEVKDTINNIKEFNNILDLACGSGTLAFMLKNSENEVTGLDLSAEMLMIANDYNHEHKKGVSFIQQDLKELTLPKNTYDLITCTLDSLNYISPLESIEHIFKEVSKALQPNGYFVFDMLTQFYIDEIVNDYYQFEDLEEFSYDWEVSKIAKHEIKHELVIEANNNIYKEEHLQYIYDFAVIEQILEKYNLEIIKKTYDYNELDESKPSRNNYITKKRG